MSYNQPPRHSGPPPNNRWGSQPQQRGGPPRKSGLPSFNQHANTSLNGFYTNKLRQEMP